MKKLIILLLIVGFGHTSYGQTYNDFKTDSIEASKPFKPSKTQFMIRGYGHTGLNTLSSEDKTESSYVGSAFAPIFLFKHSDKLMFEAELEFVLGGNELEVGLEYADVMYILNKNMTVRAGKFLLPFGTFMERLHPAWINRLPTRPLGFGHDGIAPSSGIGVELRGAFDLGGPSLNYSVYSTNGPRLKDGSEEPEEAGMLMFQNFEDNNNSKAFGGRIGLLPFADSSTEIGFSAYSTNGAGATDTTYENVGAFLYAIDFAFVKQIPAIKGFIDIKGQYNNSDIDDATFTETHEDGDEEEYTFDNKSNSFYTQLSYRPTMASSDFLKKLELVGRYSNLNTPEGAEWEEQSDQYTFGLNYWLTWRSVIKVAYETTDSVGGHDGGGTTNGFFVHWAIGF
ncbi:porin [Psychroserpens ponticola]|uniref:Porin n=1 Tax=Psychroserpens ponticola TaxID=2932268 RepID=A0ABY7RX10_9FLAO|nr:porin [Psychroserpens ponticola]WCO01292.1 porin [Psychroserpens ponticola]